MIRFTRTKPGTHIWSGTEEPFIVPEFEPLGMAEIAPSIMSRHFMGTGMSGSGKTASFVKPLARGILRYKANVPDERASLLAIDPKKDLKEELLRESHGRTVYDINSQKYKIDLFDGMDKAALTGKDLINYTSQFSDEFMKSQGDQGGSWYMSAANLIEDILDAIIHCYHKKIHINKYLAEHLDIMENYKGTNIFYYVDKILKNTATRKRQKEIFDSLSTLMAKKGKDYSIYANMADSTYSGVLFSSQMFTSLACCSEISDYLCMNPYASEKKLFSVNQAVENGDLIIFQPDNNPVSNFIGKALKSKYFESTFSRDSVLRPVAYVCDEFHRFITTDSNSGEQNFLDRCRAFRGICILATQSLHSIEAATAGLANSNQAVDIIKENTSTKFFFSSQDPLVRTHLRSTIPGPPVETLLHVVEVKLPSMLDTGECYCQSGNKWSLSKVDLGADIPTEKFVGAPMHKTEANAPGM